MTIITGRILDSGGTPINGGLIVELDAPVVDRTVLPHALYTQVSEDFEIVNGQLPIISGDQRGIVLPQTQTENVTYSFTLYRNVSETAYYFQDGRNYFGATHLHTDQKYYTGAVHSDQSEPLDRIVSVVKDPIGNPFRAIIPNVTTVDYSDLIPTGVATDKLPTTIQMLAELIVNTPQYLALLTQPKWRGVYNSSQIYDQFDEVYYAGSSWIYIASVPSSGNAPNTISPYWQLRASKGDPGGTGGTDTAYDATGWNSQLWTPSANAIRDIIETLARKSELNAYAPLQSPQLTDPVRTTELDDDDDSSALVDSEWVRRNFAPLDSADLTGNISVPLRSVNDDSNAPASTKWARNLLGAVNNKPYIIARKTASQSLINGYTNLIFETKFVDTNNCFALSPATFTAPSDGYYEFIFMYTIERSGSTAAYDVISEILHNGVGHRLSQNGAITQSVHNVTGVKHLYMTASQTALLRFFCVFSAPTVLNLLQFTEYSIKKIIL